MIFTDLIFAKQTQIVFSMFFIKVLILMLKHSVVISKFRFFKNKFENIPDGVNSNKNYDNSMNQNHKN